MGRLKGIKWDRAYECRPSHNIVSSDFHRYYPQPWKFMEGPPLVGWLLSYEYQRKWLEERELWKKRMYPENISVDIDVVKRYVLQFKNLHKPAKAPKKQPFIMKKFQNIKASTTNRRDPNDKAMSYLNKKNVTEEKKSPKKTT